MVYVWCMLRVNIYIPEEINTTVRLLARQLGKTKAEIVRMAITDGLKAMKPKKDDSAKRLLEMAELAMKIPENPYDPKDVSINHDYYLWGGTKKK